MALRIVNPVRRLIFSVPSDEFPGEFDDMYSAEVGEVIVKSDLSYVEAPEKVVQLSIPAHVECINPGLFVDFINLVEVEIRGDVYGVEWVAGMGNGTWSASLTPYTLVEELKRGKGRIEIHRSRF